jgi:general secretion pathway protein F
MPLYRYKAIGTNGEIVEGQMDAASREEVVGKLQDAGNLPLEASEAGAGGGSGLGALFRSAEMTPAEVNAFTQQLATLLGAGQPLDRALQILLDLPDRPSARRVIERIREAVRGGSSLSAALEQQHGVFSRLYVNMVRAGEVSGSLHDTLQRLTEYLDRMRSLRASVVNALVYPAIILAAVLGLVVLLMFYVVPQFKPIFADLGGELPLLTRFLLATSDFLLAWWWLGPVAIGLVAWWLNRQWADPERRRWLSERILELGALGRLVQKVETARMARTLGTLVRNGVPLLTAMSIVRNVAGNVVIAEAIDRAAEDVKVGSGLAWSLGQTKRFPRLALQMIQVGEESGELEAMLGRVADTFDQEVRNAVDRLVAMLVPAVTAFLGVVVLVVMLAILQPLLGLSQNIG